MSELIQLTDRELDEVTGGGWFFNSGNIANVGVNQVNVAKFNLVALQSNSADIDIHQKA